MRTTAINLSKTISLLLLVTSLTSSYSECYAGANRNVTTEPCKNVEMFKENIEQGITIANQSDQIDRQDEEIQTMKRMLRRNNIIGFALCIFSLFAGPLCRLICQRKMSRRLAEIMAAALVGIPGFLIKVITAIF